MRRLMDSSLRSGAIRTLVATPRHSRSMSVLPTYPDSCEVSGTRFRLEVLECLEFRMAVHDCSIRFATDDGNPWIDLEGWRF